MDICDFNPNTIKELDDKAAKLIKTKTGIPPRSGDALLYAPLTQGGLGLIKLADKLIAIKIMSKFRQLKKSSIAELTLKYTLLNEKQNNIDRENWIELLEKKGLSLNKKYNNTYSIIKIMNQKINANPCSRFFSDLGVHFFFFLPSSLAFSHNICLAVIIFSFECFFFVF